MTIRAVADTHTVLWYLYDDARLSQAAEELMDAIDAAGDQIAVSSIALAEMIYLTEKGRIAAEALERVLTELDQPDATLVDVPSIGQLPRRCSTSSAVRCRSFQTASSLPRGYTWEFQ